MAYLSRVFENAKEIVTIPNPLIFTGTQKVGAFASALKGSGVVLTRSGDSTAAHRVYADDGGAVLYGSGSVPDIRASISRVLLTKDNTSGNIRVFGLMGQLKSYDGKWNGEQVGAVYGRLEVVRSAATLTLGGYGVSASGAFTVATSGTITVNTYHILAGVAAISDFRATLTQTGVTTAFYAGAYDTTNWSDSTARTTWKYGLYIPAGACMAGIVMGQKSSSAAVGHHIGVQNSGDTAGDKAIAVFADDSNAVLASDAQGINSRCLILHAQNGAYGMSALRGHLRVVASITPSASKGFYATENYVEGSGTYTIGDGTNFTILAACGASIETGGTPTIAANAVVCGLHITGKTLPGSPTGEAVGILFQALSQGFEHTFGFTGVGTTDGNGLTTGSDSTNVTHKIAVWINGVGTRYLHVFSD
jgi:hypothetical protein